MILDESITEFRRLHGGASPSEVLVTPAAAVILAVQAALPAVWDGVKVRVGDMPPLVVVGTGTRVVLAAPDLPGGRIGVVAGEAADASP